MFLAYIRCFDFQLKAGQSEHFVFFSFNICLCIIAFALALRLFGSANTVSLPLAAVNFVPGLAAAVRRLHDQNRSGWWVLMGLVPLLGALAQLVVFCLPGVRGDNCFGADPLAPPTPPFPWRRQPEWLEDFRSAGVLSEAEFQTKQQHLLPEVWAGSNAEHSGGGS